MYDKYDYIIKKVISKRHDGRVNKYHEMIIESKCTLGMIEVGYKAGLLIEVFNQKDHHRRNWYFTSPVESVSHGDDGDLVIETVNSTYVLEKI